MKIHERTYNVVIGNRSYFFTTVLLEAAPREKVRIRREEEKVKEDESCS